MLISLTSADRGQSLASLRSSKPVSQEKVTLVITKLTDCSALQDLAKSCYDHYLRTIPNASNAF